MLFVIQFSSNSEEHDVELQFLLSKCSNQTELLRRSWTFEKL